MQRWRGCGGGCVRYRMNSDVGRELARGDWEPSVRIPQPPEPWAGSWWWWQRPWGGSLGRAGVPEGAPHWQTGRQPSL